MLKPAIKYKDQLEKLQGEIWFSDKYKYWNSSAYYESIQVDDSTWCKHQFVSVVNDEVIGYIEYNILRVEHNVTSLSIINFSNNKVVFGKDLRRALKDIFEVYKFHKINFSVIIGNPIEQSYDKMIQKYGGRIVGVFKQDAKLIDGQYYDRKFYEILADEYFHRLNNTSKINGYADQSNLASAI